MATIMFGKPFCLVSLKVVLQDVYTNEKNVTKPLQSKVKQRRKRPSKVTLEFMDQFCSNSTYKSLFATIVDDNGTIVYGH